MLGRSRPTFLPMLSGFLRLTLVLVHGALPLACAVAQQPETTAQRSSERLAQVVALVSDEQAGRSVLGAAEIAGYHLVRSANLTGLGLKMLAFDLPRTVTGRQAIAALEKAEPASIVGINETYHLQNLPATVNRYAYANALLRWPMGGCAALAPVGLIDSGIGPGGVGVSEADVISRRFVDGPVSNPRHGTEIATLLADPALLRNLKIYSADVVGSTDEGGQGARADALVRAIDWLAAEDVRVINLSLAGPYNKILNLAVQAAAARGLTMIAAAGNDGPLAGPRYPAGFESVIAVTAVDASRQIYRSAVSGPHIDIAAPGVDVFIPHGDTGRFVSGTSIAAPFVTARILADRNLLSAPNVEVLRSRLASQTEDLGAPGNDRIYGAGLLRADGACSAE